MVKFIMLCPDNKTSILRYFMGVGYLQKGPYMGLWSIWLGLAELKGLVVRLVYEIECMVTDKGVCAYVCLCEILFNFQFGYETE